MPKISYLRNLIISRKLLKKKAVIIPNLDIKELKKGHEQKGSLDTDEGLSHSIVEGNKQRVQQGMLLDSALNQGLFAFNPDMMFENLVKDYSNAEKIYGESFLRFASGYDNNTIKKNIRFPEFQRELKKNLKQTEQELKDEDLIDKEGSITDKGFSLASIVLYMQELDDLRAKGFGDKKTKKAMVYGDKENTRNFRPHDRYKDIAIKSSVRKAIRRRHSGLSNEDLQVFERDNKGKIFIVYGLDASGSMKGKKIEICKKAGIALAYKAIDEQDSVGLVVFGSEIEDVVYPTKDFSQFIHAIVKIRAKKQTDIALTIEKAIEMFPRDNVTKHLVLITDAAPTVGSDPSKNTLNLVERAAAIGITISVIGIDLNKESTELAKRIVEIGRGRLYVVKDLENLDRVVLQDYYSL
ncbi:VWA domain-containing protein [Candidatus Woesearchaeota archaeon]|nr:VWA domain-containing protein [Candidatus Woesearchaeota archaeon]